MISEVFEKTIVVRQEHLDQLNHVNNVVWLQWVQDMAEAHWQSKTTTTIENGYFWVVLNHFIEYKRQAFLGNSLLAKTFVASYEGPRSERHVEFYLDDKLCVKAKSSWCLISRASERPTRVPDEIVSLFKS